MGIKYAVNENFFDTWSDQMAYVLGYMYADGNILYSRSIRAKYISFFSTDKDRMEMIRDLMNSQHKLYVRESDGIRKQAYSLKIGSSKLFDALNAIGVTARKSHTAIFPCVPKEYLPAFILGYFDGDGCVHIERNRAGGVRRLLTIFTCGSPEFLRSLHTHIVQLSRVHGTGFCKHGSTNGTYQLRYSTRDSIRIFKNIYGSDNLRELALQRKYVIFREYFGIRGISEVDFPKILERQGPVVK